MHRCEKNDERAITVLISAYENGKKIAINEKIIEKFTKKIICEIKKATTAETEE